MGSESIIARFHRDPDMPLWKKSRKSENSQGNSDTVDMYGRDPSKFNRELDPRFAVGEVGNRAEPYRYTTTMCQVCNLQLFPKNEVPGFFPAAIHEENTQYMTQGGLSLCLRHYNLVNSLQEKQIPVDKWPSNLIRGIVKLSKEMLKGSMDAISFAQKTIGQSSTTKTVITPAPIIGNSYNPVTSFGGTGTFTNYFFAFPMQRQVVDPNAVDLVEAGRNLINTEQQKVAHYSDQLAKYAGLLEQVVHETPAKFKSCIRCGQSEIPLYETSCTWCGKSQGYTGDVVPVSCLVTDVDPLNVVPDYVDRIGAEVIQGSDQSENDDEDTDETETGIDSLNTSSQSNEKTKIYCDQCGSEISNPNLDYCDNCGTRLHKMETKNNSAIKDNPVTPSSPELPKQPSTNRKTAEPETSRESTQTVDQFSFCPECGKKLPYQGLKYCPYCGSKIFAPS